MKTLNFEILRDYAPDLANSGGFAERYVYSDPASSVVKLRIIAEQIVLHIFDCLDITLPKKPRLCDLLEEPAFQHVVPKAVRYKFDAVRIHGNSGAHGQEVSEETALWLLRETFQLMCWFFLTYLCREDSPCPKFQTPPSAPTDTLEHPNALVGEELEEFDEEATMLDIVADSQVDIKADYCLSVDIPGDPIEPIVDLHAMRSRQHMRTELGKKTQSEALDAGEKAVTTLHILEPIPLES